jgi:hypothetical protein
MYKDKATIKIGVIAGEPVMQTEVEVTVFEHLGEVTEHMSEEKMLQYINYAQRLNELRAARSKFITLHEGPQKRRQVLRMKNKA